ncbi:P-loop containing nucleoside triphosphate hydrolase protein [Boletus edulis]|nr:P-loop containing nucleoside triphosphate hydrolase protein [Boletus edulis]
MFRVLFQRRPFSNGVSRTERKRRQGGDTFLDHVIIHVRGGKGGNGCVAFHREKFKAMGPPSGGNGGPGGDIYILPTPALTSLASIPKRVRGKPGMHGRGTWQNGRNTPPTIIHVPLGTVVRELPRDDPRRAKDTWEAEEEALEGLEVDARRVRMLDSRWVHYPRSEVDNVHRDAFKQAEAALWREERERRRAWMQRAARPMHLDLSEVEQVVEDFATKGHEGERVTLELVLKIIADVGLVGMPNAGKSTLLRALTGGRTKTEVASYAFTTLNPVVGVIRVAGDGTFEGQLHDMHVFEETAVEEARRLQQPTAPEATELMPEHTSTSLGQFSILESFRFTIADNPGLIARASEDVGLGHSFLRSIERSHALVYVVDFAGPAPWDELRARLVLANKADLLGGDGDTSAVYAAREKLRRLESYVQTEMTGGRVMDVVPISAKYGQNLKRVVGLMQGYVGEAREGGRRLDQSLLHDDVLY